MINSDFIYKSLLRYFSSKEHANSSKVEQWINTSGLGLYGIYCTAICKIELPTHQLIQNDYEKVNNTYLNILSQYLEEEQLVSDPDFNLFHTEIEDNLCLLFCSSETDTAFTLENITGFLDRVVKRFEAHTSYGFISGISSIYNTIYKADTAYKEAYNALESVFYSSKGRHSFNKGSKCSFKSTLPDTSKLQSELKVSLEKASLELISQLYEKIGDAVKAENVKPSIARRLFMSVFTGTIYESIIITEEAKYYLDENYDLIPASLRLNTLEKVISFYTELTARLLQISSHSRSKAMEVIADVNKYIHENYHLPVTLKSAASHVHMNPNYLCELYKKHTGINFAQYLMQYRIERAKKLLWGTDKKIAEIAEAVGYDEIVSFNRAFKKIVSTTPTEFRKRKFTGG